MVPAVVGRVAEAQRGGAGRNYGGAIAYRGGRPRRPVLGRGVQLRQQEVVAAKLAPARWSARAESAPLTVTPQRVAKRDLFGDEQDYWDLAPGSRCRPRPTDRRRGVGWAGREGRLKAGDPVVGSMGKPVARGTSSPTRISSGARGSPPSLEIKRGSRR